jgi:hypothetical protein
MIAIIITQSNANMATSQNGRSKRNKNTSGLGVEI